MQACPDGFGQGFIADLLPIVRIKGHANIVHLAATDLVGNCVTFTVGWDGLVFVLVGPNLFEFTLLGADGMAKPMTARPVVWNLFVALGEEVEDAPPVAPDPLVADMFAGKMVAMLLFFSCFRFFLCLLYALLSLLCLCVDIYNILCFFSP